jgi:hypothetical protein
MAEGGGLRAMHLACQSLKRLRPRAGSRDCVLTLVERKTGLVLVGKLPDRTKGVVQPQGGPAHPTARRPLRNGDGRQRDGDARLRTHRAAHGGHPLLRPSVSFVGERQ